MTSMPVCSSPWIEADGETHLAARRAAHVVGDDRAALGARADASSRGRGGVGVIGAHTGTHDCITGGTASRPKAAQRTPAAPGRPEQSTGNRHVALPAETWPAAA